MSLHLLVLDELRHLARARLILYVLGALPIVLVAGGLSQIGGADNDPLFFAAAMAANLAGLACGAMVAASLIGELQDGTPVLFAVRPVPRFYLLLARFSALVLSLGGAMLVAVLLGGAVSALTRPDPSGIGAAMRSALVVTTACTVLSGSFGVLVGVSVSSILSGVLLFVVVGMNLSNAAILILPALPRWTGWSPIGSEAVIVITALLLAAAMLAISARLFSRRPL